MVERITFLRMLKTLVATFCILFINHRVVAEPRSPETSAVPPVVDTPICGNGVIDASLSEQCDGLSFPPKPDGIDAAQWAHKICDNCVIRYSPYCGDMGINVAGEECEALRYSDGTIYDYRWTVPPGTTSAQWGVRSCDPDTCKISFGPYCGDGIVNQPSELCEPSLDPDCRPDCLPNIECKYYSFTGEYGETGPAFSWTGRVFTEEVGTGTPGFYSGIQSCLSMFGNPGVSFASRSDDTAYCRFFTWAFQKLNGMPIDLPGSVDLWTISGASGCQAIREGAAQQVVLDESCNIHTGGYMPNEFCGSVSVRAISSPISLLLKPKSDINTKWSIVKFKLDPFREAQWVQWKAASDTPLLVYDPEGKGTVEDGRQLFGNYTFGKKSSGIEPVSYQQNERPWLWQNGYEALALLDKNQDGEISGSELEVLSLWFDHNQNAAVDENEMIKASVYGLRKLFYEVDFKDERGDLYASQGFEYENSNGEVVHGASVDWFTKSYSTFDAAIAAESKQKIAMETIESDSQLGDESPKALQPEKIDGMYLWSPDKKVDGLQPAGILFLLEKEGKILGYSVVEELFKKNKAGVASRLTKYPITGVRKDSTDGIEMTFDILDMDGGKTRTSARLQNGELKGKSFYSFKNKAKETMLSYEWTGRRVQFPRK